MKRNKQWNEKNRRGAYRGAALRLLASHDEDVTRLTRLVEEEGRADLAYHLAISLSNRGSALCDVHRPARALVDYNKAAGILTRLIEQEGRADLVGVLASVLTSRGSAFTDLGHLPEALADHDRAVATFTRLIEEE